MSSSGTNVNQVEPTLINWNQVESSAWGQHSILKNPTPSTMQLFGFGLMLPVAIDGEVWLATPSMNADQGDDMWQCRCFVSN